MGLNWEILHDNWWSPNFSVKNGGLQTWIFFPFRGSEGGFRGSKSMRPRPIFGRGSKGMHGDAAQQTVGKTVLWKRICLSKCMEFDDPSVDIQIRHTETEVVWCGWIS